MRYLGALLLFPVLGLGTEEVIVETETLTTLSAEEFDACLEAQREHVRIFAEQTEVSASLFKERIELIDEHQRHWEETSPKLIGVGSAAMNPTTDEDEFSVRLKLNTVRGAYRAAVSLLQSKTSEIIDRTAIGVEIEQAWRKIIDSGNQTLQVCAPVLEFVATGLDGTTGQREQETN